MRVLLLGNVANNSFYAAKLLRRYGVEADVLSTGYHVMSSPEWEDADFERPPSNLDRPNWSAMNLGDYHRPRWFAQGPVVSAAAYLTTWRDGDEALADAAWLRLERAAWNEMFPPPRPLRVKPRPGLARRSARFAVRAGRRIVAELRAPDRGDEIERGALDLAVVFAQRFGSRPDRLAPEDIRPHLAAVRALAPLFRRYDVVHGSATDPLYPMLARHVPYVAFEHGTLRDSPHVTGDFKGPSYPNAIGRLTALAYARAGHVFITNADCREAAERLGLQRYSAMPHPFDEQAFRPPAEEVDMLRRSLGVDHVFLCPLRHDWKEKGTDRYLRALPELRARIPGRFRAYFMEWGNDYDKSVALTKELGVDDLVVWLGPQGRVRLARWLAAADAVWDQVAYPSMSGTGPRTLAAGTPVIGAYDPRRLEWMFSEPAPILGAMSVAEIVEQTLRVLAPGFRTEYAARARGWIDRHHSGERVVQLLLAGYETARTHGSSGAV